MKNYHNDITYLRNQRWCGFKKDIEDGNVKNISYQWIDFDNGKKRLAIGCAEITDKAPKYFMMPLVVAENKSGEQTLKMGKKLYTDAVKQSDFWSSLTAFLKESGNQITFPNGCTMKYVPITDNNILDEFADAKSKPLGVEQSNSTVVVGDKQIAFKLERMLSFSDCENTEFEMNKKLMKENCSVMPETYGCLILQDPNGKTSPAGIMQKFVPNNGDLWNYSLNYLVNRLENAYEKQNVLKPCDNTEFMNLMNILRDKTDEMSDCLCKDDNNPDFAPEAVDDKFVFVYKKQLNVLMHVAKKHIADNLEKLPTDIKEKTSFMLNNWDKLTNNFVNEQLNKINTSADKGVVCRVHGDFHLGQVMVTKDNDLKFIDFAGEPALTPEQRRQKHISVRDYAGMYRSVCGYLGAVAVEEFAKKSDTPENVDARKKFAQKAIAPLIDKAGETFLGKHSLNDPWLKLEIFRKNLYEVKYEVANRPEMAYIPINGLSNLLKNDTPYPNINKNKYTR